MKIAGIICEYNPFHLGHGKQIRMIRSILGEDCAIVCLMSGNYVQRGHPAILDKSLRAEAALRCGADLVLELPVTVALSSAEGFAAGGVRILSQLCTHLCFGCESGDGEALMETAAQLLQPDFPERLRGFLDQGLSFPAARAAALEAMGADKELLNRPNDILAVEYCKAILSQNAAMELLPIQRLGGYHDSRPDPENPSATALRGCMTGGAPWQTYVPGEALEVFREAPIHTLEAGERAMLTKLRMMTEEEFSQLPFGSEGLWRKFMHSSRREATLEDILTATKSKRYTRSRLDRMAMCAFLGITREMMEAVPPYSRILGFTHRGREVLKTVKTSALLVNAGERTQGPCWELEQRCGNLYGLFCVSGPEAPGAEVRRRIVYLK